MTEQADEREATDALPEPMVGVLAAYERHLAVEQDAEAPPPVEIVCLRSSRDGRRLGTP